MAQLRDVVRHTFALDGSFALVYKDDEQDSITVSSEAELKEAITAGYLLHVVPTALTRKEAMTAALTRVAGVSTPSAAALPATMPSPLAQGANTPDVAAAADVAAASVAPSVELRSLSLSGLTGSTVAATAAATAAAGAPATPSAHPNHWVCNVCTVYNLPTVPL
jgi:hypothetical protein